MNEEYVYKFFISLFSDVPMSDEEVEKYSKLQRKLSNQIAMIILDVIADYTRYFKVKYMSKDVKYHHYDSKYKNGANNKVCLDLQNSKKYYVLLNNENFDFLY